MITLLSNIRRFGQLYIIFGLAICLFVSESHSTLYKAKLATAQIQLSTYELESRRLADRIKQAQQAAEEASKRYDNNIKAILNAPISSRCEDVIQWGIQQARLF